MKVGSQVYGVVAAVAAAACLAGCATPTIGTSFVRPPPDFVRLGETTRTQIVERYGKPQEEQEVRADGQLMHVISYYYGSHEETPRVPGSVCIRTLHFALFADTVVAERFTSSCEADHTDFDESKAAGIVKGKSRCDDVIQAMGRPHVQSIYPDIGNKDERSIGYRFDAMGSGPSFSPTISYRYTKQLEVICDREGVVRDMSLFEEGKR